MITLSSCVIPRLFHTHTEIYSRWPLLLASTLSSVGTSSLLWMGLELCWRIRGLLSWCIRGLDSCAVLVSMRSGLCWRIRNLGSCIFVCLRLELCWFRWAWCVHSLFCSLLLLHLLHHLVQLAMMNGDHCLRTGLHHLGPCRILLGGGVLLSASLHFNGFHAVQVRMECRVLDPLARVGFKLRRMPTA